MKTIGIDRPTFDDPLYDQKNPHQVFLLVFSIVAAFPIFVGGESVSNALDRSLSTIGVIAWGVCLFFGSIVALAGEFWPGRTWDALTIEGAGLALVALGGVIFVFFLFREDPDFEGTRYVAGLTTAYTLSCAWRVGQIIRRLLWLRDVIEEYTAIKARQA